jgi:hypothetical protein
VRQLSDNVPQESDQVCIGRKAINSDRPFSARAQEHKKEKVSIPRTELYNELQVEKKDALVISCQ